jgi:hypothetical protein
MKRSFVVPAGGIGLAAVVVIPTVLIAWALINGDPSSRLWGITCLGLGRSRISSRKLEARWPLMTE